MVVLELEEVGVAVLGFGAARRPGCSDRSGEIVDARLGDVSGKAGKLVGIHEHEHSTTWPTPRNLDRLDMRGGAPHTTMATVI